MEFHESANIFPMMGVDEFAALKAGIAAYGLQEPIVLAEGKIAEGRNRYNACIELGIEPQYVEWNGDGSLLAFIISKNASRRHMSESRRAMTAARLAILPKGRLELLVNGSIEPFTQGSVGNLLNVGRESVKRARIVLTDGVPELIDIVDRGKVTEEQRKDVAVSLAAKVSEWASADQGEFVHRVKQGETPSQVYRDIRHREKRIQPFPIGKYQVIYADPPWQYSNTGFDQSADAQYPTMTVEEIFALPVAQLATEASVLFLWATNPLLPEAIRVLGAWGFEYKTNMVWVKDREPGIGWWLESKHELLLISVRTETPQPAVRPPSVFEADRGPVHSRKPEKAYEFIEAMYPEGNKVELFSRNRRDGWEMWGNEVQRKILID